MIAAISALFGSGGVFAWFKLRAEKGQIVISAAQSAVLVHSGVLKDIQEAYDRLSDELAQMKMEAISREVEIENCQSRIRELQQAQQFLQQELDRHGRMTELARQRSHIALNTVSAYELRFDKLFTELTSKEIEIDPKFKPSDLMKAFRDEMAKVQELESLMTEQAIKARSPDDPLYADGAI